MRIRNEFDANEAMSKTKVNPGYMYRIHKPDPWYVHPFVSLGIFVGAMALCALFIKHFG